VEKRKLFLEGEELTKDINEGKIVYNTHGVM